MRINNYFKIFSLVAVLGIANAQAQQAPSRAANGSKALTGKLEISVPGSETETSTATITITPNGDGTYTFLLPGFSYGTIVQNLDIQLTKVTATTEGIVTTYASSEAETLMIGVLPASTTISGTVNALGEANLAIAVNVAGQMNIDVKFTAEACGTAYAGTLAITDASGTTNTNATIYVTPNNVGDGTYTFTLPNFTYLTFGPMNIELNNVSATTDGTVTTYSGTTYIAALVADTSLNGTIDANGNVNLTIVANVAGQMNIDVKFTATGSNPAGIAEIDANAGAAEYFTIGGLRVAQPASGLYIVKQGNRTSKVLVK